MYNPSEVGRKENLFGFPYSKEESNLIIIPIELDVTVSYGAGTSAAPKLILEESSQLDLSLPTILHPWKMKMVVASPMKSTEKNQLYRTKAKEIIEHLERGTDPNESQLIEVNKFCEEVHKEVEMRCDELIKKNKLVAVLGGDHSSPLGLMRSLAKIHEFGILQIDAHMDLRYAYEGFEFSHASIMRNAMKIQGVSSLTQVGIRDYCEEEELFIKKSEKPLHVFFDEVMYAERLNGKTWERQVANIVETIPDKVYISFDIDGLDPSLCPNTGTPVPGGLKFNEAIFLIEQVVRSGRRIVGFDLCEVGNSNWDANVGARILYRLATAAGVSHGLLEFK